MIERGDQITKNFNIDEFFTHQNQFDQQSWDYLNKQMHVFQNRIFNAITVRANNLQKLRDQWGKVIHIDSGYRCPAVNTAVGGKPDSFHLKGMASDIVVEGMTPKEVQLALYNWTGGLGSYQTFTHIDDRPYRARWSG